LNPSSFDTECNAIETVTRSRQKTDFAESSVNRKKVNQYKRISSYLHLTGYQAN